MKKDFIDIWISKKAKQSIEHEEFLKKHREIEKKQSKEIQELLKSKYNVHEISTNDYVFCFHYKGMFVDFVNQNDNSASQVINSTIYKHQKDKSRVSRQFQQQSARERTKPFSDSARLASS